MNVFPQSRRWDTSAVEIFVNFQVFFSVPVKRPLHVHTKDDFPQALIWPVILRVTPHSFEVFDNDEYPWVGHIHIEEEILEVLLAYLLYQNCPHDFVFFGNVYAVVRDMMRTDINEHFFISPLVRRRLLNPELGFMSE